MRAFVLSFLLVSATTACSNNDTTNVATDAGPGGGPVSGAADTHCTVPTKKVTVVDPAACQPDAGTAVDASSDAAMDAAMDGMAPEEAASTMYGTEGDDDDCKYHMKWSITPTHEGEDETVTLTLTKIADGQPATGASPALEIYLDPTHLAPGLGAKAVEVSPGTYQISGVRFDASGTWTLRFHVYEGCVDSETSPHGHAAFFVSVP
jgi:hypothetical protein